MVNEKYSDDSDTGSGYKIKSLFAPTNRRKETEGALMPGISVTVTPDPSPAGRKKSIVSVGSNTSERSMPISTLSSLPRNFSAVRSSQGMCLVCCYKNEDNYNLTNLCLMSDCRLRLVEPHR